MMRLWQSAALLASGLLASGCLDMIIPSHDAGGGGDMGVKTASGTPLYDLGQTLAADPTVDGGGAVHFAQIQAQFDSLGCTTSQCHGGSQVPVLTATPANDAMARANYFDLLDGCANGTPDSADCIDTRTASMSLLLAKTCATSSMSHAGGKPFADDTNPTYQLWQGWIAAGAPY